MCWIISLCRLSSRLEKSGICFNTGNSIEASALLSVIVVRLEWFILYHDFMLNAFDRLSILWYSIFGENKNKYIKRKVMLTLSQNKKIAISAIALFLVSFMGMLFFLKNNGTEIENGHVNILEVGGHGEEGASETEIIVIDPETMYRDYLDGTENPIFVVNAEGEIVFASDDCCKLLDTECKDFEGTSFFEYINTNDLPDFVTAQMRVMNDPKLTEGMGPFRMISGEDNIIALFNAYPVLDESGKVQEVVFSINDITAQVEEMNMDGDIDAAASALVTMM